MSQNEQGSNLFASISADDTTVCVHQAATFSTGWYARVDSEVIKILTSAGGGINPITFLRAQLGTVAAAHEAGAPLLLLDPVDVVAAQQSVVATAINLVITPAVTGGVLVLGGDATQEFSSTLPIPSWDFDQDFTVSFVLNLDGTLPVNPYIDMFLGSEEGVDSGEGAFCFTIYGTETPGVVRRLYAGYKDGGGYNVIGVQDSGVTTGSRDDLGNYALGTGRHTFLLSYVAETTTLSFSIDGVVMGMMDCSAFTGVDTPGIAFDSLMGDAYMDDLVIMSAGVEIVNESFDMPGDLGGDWVSYYGDPIHVAASVELSPSAIKIDASRGSVFTLLLTENTVLAAPTGAVDGQHLVWIITQDETGGRTLDTSALAGTVTIGAAANAITIVEGYYLAATGLVQLVQQASSGSEEVGIPDGTVLKDADGEDSVDPTNRQLKNSDGDATLDYEAATLAGPWNLSGAVITSGVVAATIVPSVPESTILDEPFTYGDGDVGGDWVAIGTTLQIVSGQVSGSGAAQWSSRIPLIIDVSKGWKIAFDFIMDHSGSDVTTATLKIVMGNDATSNKVYMDLRWYAGGTVNAGRINRPTDGFTVGSSPTGIADGATHTASLEYDGVSVLVLKVDDVVIATSDGTPLSASNVGSFISIKIATVANTVGAVDNLVVTQALIPASFSTDATLGSIFTATLTENAVLNAPTNMVNGQRFTWIIAQDGTGNWTLDVLAFAGGVTVQSTANAVTIIEGCYLASLGRVVIR